MILLCITYSGQYVTFTMWQQLKEFLPDFLTFTLLAN